MRCKQTHNLFNHFVLRHRQLTRAIKIVRASAVCAIVKERTREHRCIVHIHLMHFVRVGIPLVNYINGTANTSRRPLTVHCLFRFAVSCRDSKLMDGLPKDSLRRLATHPLSGQKRSTRCRPSSSIGDMKQRLQFAL